MSLSLPILDRTAQRPVFAQGPRSLSSVRLLRMSLTDRCNLRCVYCMPDDGVTFYDHQDLLTADDYLAVAAAARSVGVDHFKLTGGEPTLRKDLVQIVRRLKALGPADLSMTTNGIRLGQQGGKLARQLREAGLDRLTVSLDAVDEATFDRVSGRRGFTLGQVWAGIEAAEAAGFERLKINSVVIRGMNDDQAPALAALTLDRPCTVRFIEYMPLGDSALIDAPSGVGPERYTVDNHELRGRIEAALGPLSPLDRGGEVGVGPANVFRLPEARGKVGFISAMSQPFCESCNRLRLTARGELRACLFDGGEVDILPTLRDPAGPDTQALVGLMARCVVEKPDTHSSRGNRAMSQLGG